MTRVVRDRVLGLARVRAGDLVDHPDNYRRHPARQRAALKAMLARIGFASALVARREGAHLILIDGHLRKDLVPEQIVPVLVLDVTAEEADELILTLDPIAALARPDPEPLAALLERVRISNEEVADLLEELARSAGLPLADVVTDPDVIPERAPARTSPGELFELGPHRLLCADATSPEALDLLMAGERADLLLTDPPYGVSYAGRTKHALTIRNDDASGLERLLHAAFANVTRVLADGAGIYVFSPGGPNHLVFLQAFFAQGWRYHQGLVWSKGPAAIGHSDYHFAHEQILYGYAATTRRRGRGQGGWYGGNDQTTVLSVPKPARSADHPTTKPVELLRRLISNSSRRDQIVLDPFVGSGSSLIAAEILDRRLFGMEIDPVYCDVALARYEAVTGRRAIRSEGKRVDA